MPWISIETKSDAGETAAEPVAPVPSGGESRRGRGVWLGLAAGALLLVVLAVGAGWWISQRGSSVAGGATTGGDTVALVNGEAITTGDVERELALQRAMKAQSGQVLSTDPAEIEAFKRDILDQLVEQRLMYQDAVARGMDLPATQTSAELAQWTPGLDLSRLQTDAQAAGVTPDGYAEWGRRQVVLAHYLRDPAVQQLGVEQVKASGGQLRSAQASDVAAALEAKADIQFRFSAFGGSEEEKTVPMAKEGELAPDFTLTTPDGETVSLSDYRGKPVLVNFWATWCGPCKVEMPLYVHVYGQNKDKGLVVLGVNVQEDAEKVKAFRDQYGLNFPIALDQSGQVSTLYRVRGLPTSVLVAPDGTIAEAHRGAIVQREQLLELIRNIMPDVGA